MRRSLWDCSSGLPSRERGGGGTGWIDVPKDIFWQKEFTLYRGRGADPETLCVQSDRLWLHPRGRRGHAKPSAGGRLESELISGRDFIKYAVNSTEFERRSVWSIPPTRNLMQPRVRPLAGRGKPAPFFWWGSGGSLFLRWRFMASSLSFRVYVASPTRSPIGMVLAASAVSSGLKTSP